MIVIDPEKFKKKFGHSPFEMQIADDKTALSYRHECDVAKKTIILPRWAPNIDDSIPVYFPWQRLDEFSLALEFCPFCLKPLQEDELEQPRNEILWRQFDI